VQRQELLQSGKITTADISPNNLREYSHFKLINALNDFDDALAYPLSRILNLPGKNSVEAEIN
jgi:4-amino-4-deoxychorismate lyase